MTLREITVIRALQPTAIAVSFALLFLQACGHTQADLPGTGSEAALRTYPEDAFFSQAETQRRLWLLHSADNEAALLGSTPYPPPEQDTQSASINGVGGIARMAAAMDAVRAQAEKLGVPTLTVAAGDTFLPAPELKVQVEKQNAVAYSNNLLGYAASALGNHELDFGDEFFADYLKQSSFPYLTSTVHATAGPLAKRQVNETELQATGAWTDALAGKLSPRAKVCVGQRRDSGCNGWVIGLVGATTPMLRTVSKPSDDVEIVDTIEEVLAKVQEQVARLKADSVDTIVLLSHLQDVRLEQKLIELGLTDVDVIIAGGGDNLMANPGHRLLPQEHIDTFCTSAARSCYPKVLQARDGHPVLLVSGEGQLHYLGLLGLAFDAEGHLTGYQRAITRPWPVDDQMLQTWNAVPQSAATQLESQLRAELATKNNAFATSAFFLEGRREAVRNRETNLGNLSADSMVHVAQRFPPRPDQVAEFAVRNGGGIRAGIGAIDPKSLELEGGPISQLDLESSLRFDGNMVVVTTTHRALKDTLEASLRGAGTGRGHFPQVSEQVYLEYTTQAPEQVQKVEEGRVVGLECTGKRVRTLRIVSKRQGFLSIVEDGELVTPDARISYATLGYLAKGGDGWFPGSALPGERPEIQRSGTPVLEQEALRTFITDLEAAGDWNQGQRYIDPQKGIPASFSRIRELTGVVVADEDCPCTP